MEEVQLPEPVLVDFPAFSKKSVVQQTMDAKVSCESGKLKSPASGDRSGCQKRFLLAELLVGREKKLAPGYPKSLIPSELPGRNFGHSAMECLSSRGTEVATPFLKRCKSARRAAVGVLGA